MSAQGPSQTERLLAALPAWLLVAGGMMMLAAAVLIPALIDTNRLLHQRDNMREQAAAMSKMADNYKAFNTALQQHDPVVLERLAYAQLRRKPAGVDPLLIAVNPGQPITPRGWMRTTGSSTNANVAASTTQIADPPPDVASIESLIGDPTTIATIEMPLYQPPRGRIVRLTTGSMRVGFMIAAAGLVVAGLMWNTNLPATSEYAVEDDESEDDEEWVTAELDSEEPSRA
jgi:hypothetical protein